MIEAMQRPHTIVWFEIPAHDVARASRFYEQVLGVTLKPEPFGPKMMAIFPYEKPNVSGCIASGPGCVPGADGVVAFLNAEPELDPVLARVAAAGGSVVQRRTELPAGMGAYAKIRDTEGNTVGLHALA